MVLDTPKFVLPCSTTLPVSSTFKIEDAVTSLNNRPVGATKYRFSSLSSPVAQTWKEITFYQKCYLLNVYNVDLNFVIILKINLDLFPSGQV